MKKLCFLILILSSISALTQTYSYTTYNTSNSGIGSNYIADIKADANGLLWLATSNGVSTFNGTAFTNYNTANSGIASNSIIKIQIDGLGRKWIASQLNGITLYNGTTWTNYTTSNSGLPTNAINDIAVDGQNNLWIATDSGLTKFNGTTWTTYTSAPNLNSVATDSNNGVWVTNGGVLYKFNGTDFDFVAQGTERILKIANNTVYVKGSDSLITLTTSGTNLTFIYQSTSCLSGYNLNALDVDSNSKVWIGFNGTGLQNFTDCTAYTKTNTNLGLPDDYFSAVKTQPSGTIWLGTLQLGLTKMAPSTVQTGCFQKISTGSLHSVAIKTDGTLWSWGSNYSGQLGNGTTTNSSTPKQIGTGNNWKEIAGGSSHTIAQKTDGTLWAWGANSGQLGNGTNTDQHTPVQVGSANDNDWKTFDSGMYHTVAIRNNGTLWAWGLNPYGQLGTGNTTTSLVPVQIGTAANWLAVQCGQDFTVALKTDGTLWAWGSNTYGTVGDASNTNRLVPTQIGTANNWQSLGVGALHVTAIKTDGTLWAWGYNTNGQLGDGTTTDKNIPTQIGTAADWKTVASGGNHTLAIKSNGTLWAWGRNQYGQLGNGLTANSNVPVQIGNLTTWKTVAGGISHTFALKSDGTGSTWGLNLYGQLGDGSNVDKKIPTALACPTLGVDDFTTLKNTIKAYPNPVNDKLIISFDEKISLVSVYNVLGQEVLNKEINANEATIDFSALASGVYFVKVNSNDTIKTVKIIKK